jgi:hypothetical protein
MIQQCRFYLLMIYAKAGRDDLCLMHGERHRGL